MKANEKTPTSNKNHPDFSMTLFLIPFFEVWADFLKTY